MQSSIREQLEEMQRLGGTAFVEEVIELFFSECDMRFVSLKKFVEEADLEEAGRIFHQLKGSAASTGTGRLYRIAVVGELASETSDAVLARRACYLAIREVNLLRKTLTGWKQGLAS